MRDVAFWKNNKRVDYKSASLVDLLAYDGATLRIENQKNGEKINQFFMNQMK